MVYHMTVPQIMRPSDANGKHFNLSKNDCAHCCLYLTAVLLTSLFCKEGRVGEKKGNAAPENKKYPDKIISFDGTCYSQKHVVCVLPKTGEKSQRW